MNRAIVDQTSLTISTNELRAMLEQQTPVTVLDIRPETHRAEWAIPGSLFVDAYDAVKAGNASILDTLELPTDRPVITVCLAGGTSVIAAEYLRDRGIDARSLAGGMKAWSLAWNSAELVLPTSNAKVVQVRRTGKGCLSYMVGSGGEAAVIDASLDADVYLDLARHQGWSITRVIETHIHADHLMRSRQLATRTGATLHLPAQDRVAYPFAPLRDGDTVGVGDSTLQVIATPGHTLESVSYLLDRTALFTGDTLFLDGVGRPDLEAAPAQVRERAHLLHHSLQRLLTLPPWTVVLPGHTSQPVAFDREPVRATLRHVHDDVDLLDANDDDFVATLLDRIPASPPNHHRIVALNEAGSFPEGDPTDLEAGANRCAIA